MTRSHEEQQDVPASAGPARARAPRALPHSSRAPRTTPYRAPPAELRAPRAASQRVWRAPLCPCQPGRPQRRARPGQPPASCQSARTSAARVTKKCKKCTTSASRKVISWSATLADTVRRRARVRERVLHCHQRNERVRCSALCPAQLRLVCAQCGDGVGVDARFLERMYPALCIREPLARHRRAVSLAHRHCRVPPEKCVRRAERGGVRGQRAGSRAEERVVDLRDGGGLAVADYAVSSTVSSATMQRAGEETRLSAAARDMRSAPS
jgi:hypothetical protein